MWLGRRPWWMKSITGERGDESQIVAKKPGYAAPQRLAHSNAQSGALWSRPSPPKQARGRV